MKAFLILVGIAATCVILGAVVGPSDDDKRMANFTPDEKLCVYETRDKFLHLTDEQIAALPGSYKDAFAWEVIACVGRKMLVRQKMAD